MAYRLCEAGVSLRSAINNKYPNRDKSSDGWIGDAAHATRSSDHNPWVIKNAMGIVRAIDVDVDGVDMAFIMENLRILGANGDPRLAGGGYLIFNRRITNPDFKSWRVYTGSNPHTKHGHISFTLNLIGFDLIAPWPFLSGAQPSKPVPNKPRVKEIDLVQNFPIAPGKGDIRLICPTGINSAAVARSFVSAVVRGPQSGWWRVWFQDDRKGLADREGGLTFANGLSEREWYEAPDGTTQMNIQYDFPNGGDICIETVPK